MRKALKANPQIRKSELRRKLTVIIGISFIGSETSWAENKLQCGGICEADVGNLYQNLPYSGEPNCAILFEEDSHILERASKKLTSGNRNLICVFHKVQSQFFLQTKQRKKSRIRKYFLFLGECSRGNNPSQNRPTKC